MKLALVIFFITLTFVLKPDSSTDDSSNRATVARTAACEFDAGRREFVGDPREQAKCLLRPVGKGARLGPALERLPEPLNTLIGNPATITKEQLRAYLQRTGISEDEVGGSLDKSLSETDDGLAARYFVIHDTSSPFYDGHNFPADIDASSWPGNNLSNWIQLKVAHVYVNRIGESLTAIDLSRPWRATKKENTLGKSLRGRFIHVECVQPRRSDPNGASGNDLVSPDEAFTTRQLNRLALLYVAASVRGRKWLIPAFHAVIDAEFENAHDDPQGFDLEAWSKNVAVVIDPVK